MSEGVRPDFWDSDLRRLAGLAAPVEPRERRISGTQSFLVPSPPYSARSPGWRRRCVGPSHRYPHSH
eukprot:scaffold159552_cov28-Tisochrysis_lutea.AAC.1